MMWRRGNKHACEVCKAPCSMMCQGCKTIHYCSAEHQSLDWDQHKATCQLYSKVYIKPKSNNFFRKRRTLVAQSSFRKGKSICIESAIVESPDNMLTTSKELELGMTGSCIVCRVILPTTFQTLDGVAILNTCNNCCWPLCGNKECYSFHVQMECSILSKNKGVGPEIFSKTMPPWRFVFYLRVLKLRDKNASNYSKIMEMDVHPELDEHEVITSDLEMLTRPLPLIAHEQTYRLKEFVRLLELHNVFKSPQEEISEIVRLIQVIDWNSRVISMPSMDNTTLTDRYFNGLFYISPTALQSCTPNAFCIRTSDFKLQCIATQDIEPGSTICMNQDPSSSHLDNMGRRRRMRERFLSKCYCNRCLDPTEMKSYNGAFLCCDIEGEEIPGCKVGLLLPQVQEKKSKSLKRIVDVWTWKCDQCGVMRSMKLFGPVRAKILARKVELFKQCASTSTKLLYNNSDASIDSLIGTDQILKFMKEQENILHQNNFIMTQIRLKLMEWYSEAIHKIFVTGKQNEFKAHILDGAQKLHAISSAVTELVNLYHPGLNYVRSYLDYFKQQGFILMAPKLLRTLPKTDEEKANFQKQITEITTLRKNIRIFCKHTMDWNWKPETNIQRLEWVDIDGQLYQLLKRQYPIAIPRICIRLAKH